MPKIISLHDVLEPLKRALLASRDVIISSQICGSNLQKVFTLGDGCWLPMRCDPQSSDTQKWLSSGNPRIHSWLCVCGLHSLLAYRSAYRLWGSLDRGVPSLGILGLTRFKSLQDSICPGAVRAFGFLALMSPKLSEIQIKGAQFAKP